MSFIIKDGAGNGYTAKVDNENRLHTHAFTVSIEQAATLRGDTFNTSTGVITLTSDSESAIFYIKNTGTDDILVFEQFLDVGTSTGGASDFVTIKYYTGATGGTIISNAVAGVADNRRLLDSTVLDADVYKGAETYTLTGGDITSFLTKGFQNPSPFVIPPGVALGVAIIPDTGNTSQAVTFGLNLIINASTYGND